MCQGNKTPFHIIRILRAAYIRYKFSDCVNAGARVNTGTWGLLDDGEELYGDQSGRWRAGELHVTIVLHMT